MFSSFSRTALTSVSIPSWVGMMHKIVDYDFLWSLWIFSFLLSMARSLLLGRSCEWTMPSNIALSWLSCPSRRELLRLLLVSYWLISHLSSFITNMSFTSISIPGAWKKSQVIHFKEVAWSRSPSHRESSQHHHILLPISSISFHRVYVLGRSL